MWSVKVDTSQLLVTGPLLHKKGIKSDRISMSDLLPWKAMSTVKIMRDGPKKSERCTKLAWVACQKVFLEVRIYFEKNIIQTRRINILIIEIKYFHI